MEQKFERIAPGLYRREYSTAAGESSVFYYGRLKCKNASRSLFALGTDLREAKDRWAEIKIANRRGENLSRFKPEKAKPEPTDAPMTFRRYAEIYLDKPEAKALKSHRRDCDFVKHLKAFLAISC
jgi:hypothetical protein